MRREEGDVSKETLPNKSARRSGKKAMICQYFPRRHSPSFAFLFLVTPFFATFSTRAPAFTAFNTVFFGKTAAASGRKASRTEFKQ